MDDKALIGSFNAPTVGPTVEIEYFECEYMRFEESHKDSLKLVRKTALKMFRDNSAATELADLHEYRHPVDDSYNDPCVLFMPGTTFVTLDTHCKTMIDWPANASMRRRCTFELLKPGTQFSNGEYNEDGEFLTRYLFSICSLKLVNAGTWQPTAG